MSVFILQLIAMVTMLTDHIGYYLCGNHIIFRVIGRTAFILYAFLLAEGFHHYKDDNQRLFKHIVGLLITAVVSEIAFDLVRQEFNTTDFVIKQNIIFTLLISILGLTAIKLSDGNRVYQFFIILSSLFIAYALHTDYAACGVLLVYLFYYYQEHFLDKNFGVRLCVLAGVMLIYLCLLHYQAYDFANFTNFFGTITEREAFRMYGHIVPIILLSLYNGKLGYTNRQFKLVYKYFYPLHLFIIYMFICILKY